MQIAQGRGGELWFTWGDNGAGAGPLSSPSCSLMVHPFVPGSTGSG